MLFHLLRRFAPQVGMRLVALGAVVLLLAFVSFAAEPLARPEFDKEVSLQMKQANLVDVFQMFAKFTSVPFVLEVDGATKIDLEAKNMVFRGILASLASTYDLEYSETGEGIVVRRNGAPPSGTRVTVGAWPPKAGAPYELEIVVRDPNGKVLATPHITTLAGTTATVRVGLRPDAATTIFDKERGILEREALNGLQARIFVKGESAGGLDLVMEMTRTRIVDAMRHVQEYTVAARTVPKNSGETTLFQTDDGHQVVLLRWSAR